MRDSAEIVMERINALGQISEESRCLTRTFCSNAMRRANDLVGSWMREAGMAVREDAIGNLIGRYQQKTQDRDQRSEVRGQQKVLLLGSHLDTVRDAGKFDGALGVMVAIACVEHLHASGARLPFDIEVVAFADEEGVRYRSTYLGSKLLAGTFNLEDLQRTDEQGFTMAEAIRSFGGNPEALASAGLDPNRLVGYVEVHIEQGPVLEQKNLAVGVVTAIAGQTRKGFRFFGRAGHAGTVPMDLRTDALCAAAEFVLAVEAHARACPALVATVGELNVLPGASNVIPGEVSLSLDVRHADDAVRETACAKLQGLAKTAGEKRGVDVKISGVHESRAVVCDQRLRGIMQKAVRRHQSDSVLLPSGAGHDAVTMAAITSVAMLFVRCKGGISHHPDEAASVEDVRVAIAVMTDFIRLLAEES